jgi:hypothetical protein
MGGWRKKTRLKLFYCREVSLPDSLNRSTVFCSETVDWVLLGKLSKVQISAKLLNTNIFRIAQRFNHPEYRKPFINHDIALYKLDKEVRFSPFVRPICLYTSAQTPTNYVKKNVVAGWGSTGTGKNFNFKIRIQKERVKFSKIYKMYIHRWRPKRRTFESDDKFCRQRRMRTGVQRRTKV